MTAADDRQDVVDTCVEYSWYADNRDWDGMADLFTNKVVLDNSSMPGGSVATLDRVAMIESWAALFRCLGPTQHLMTNHLVELDASAGTAVCIAQYLAQHLALAPVAAGDATLVVAGHYRFELVREADRWRIRALTIAQTWSSGNLAVLGWPGPAVDAASTARRFLAALDAGDVDTAIACLADDVVQDMPYSPPGYPKQLHGAEALRGLWTGLVAATRSMDFTVVDVRPFPDPQWAFVEFTADLVQPTGALYTNHYFTFFHVVDGRIVLYRELYDPIAFNSQVSDEDRALMFRTGEGAKT